jgi:probable F420-dependent oxidoreductase
MDFGVNMLTRGITGGAEGLRAMAVQADALGFAHVTANDHIVVPNHIASRYPYTPTGAWPGARAGECLEQVTVLGFLAAATSRIRLGTSVMVVPQRPAVLAAKALATVDVLSQGRLTVGVGVGWLDEEFRAVAAPPFAERGKVTDEFLAAFHELWTSEAPRFAGTHVSFADIRFDPKPVQKPRPPIWVGGEGAAALRRVARLGDGWYPVGSNPREPLDTPARYAAQRTRLEAEVAGAGRDPKAIALAYLAPGRCQPAEQKGPDGRRQPYSGRPADVAADISAFADAGVGHFFLSFSAPTLPEALADLAWFGGEVRPLVAGIPS